MVTRAAIYTRLSRDPRGDKPNIADQQRRCEALAEKSGYEVVRVFEDRDKTAAGRDPHRPAYAELLGEIKSRTIDAVLVMDMDRLVREPRELETLMDLCLDSQVGVLSTDGELDAKDDSARVHARIKAAVAADEVAKMSKRQRRAAERNALAGKRTGGGHRMFGYTKEMEVLPGEAEHLRGAVASVLSGHSLSSVVARFNTRGVPTVAGGTWSLYGLKRLLANPTIAGWVNHHGEAAAEGAWEPIITLEDHQCVKGLLFDAKRTPLRQTRGRRYALTGLLFCSKCGARMIHRSHTKDPLGVMSCPPRAHGGCGGIGVKQRHAEPLIVAVVVDALADGGIAKAIASHAGDDARLKAAGEKMAELSQHLEDIETNALVNNTYGAASVLRAREALRAQIEEQRRVLASTEARMLTDLPQDRHALMRLFEGQTPQWRRDILGAVLHEVIVHPAKGTNVFNPRRMEFRWRT